MELLNIPGFDAIFGYSQEYLHGWGLGTVKRLHTNVSKKILTPAQRNEVDKRLLDLKPPRKMYRVPETIKNTSVWKGADWIYFILFYALPSLDGVLESKYLELYLILSNSLHLLLGDVITYEELKECEENLNVFVNKCQKKDYFGKEFISFNIHIMSHVCACVEKNGPLSKTSAFTFESKIAQIIMSVNGPTRVTEQIAESVAQYFTYRNKMILEKADQNDPISSFCKERFFNVPPATFNFKELGKDVKLYTDHSTVEGTYSRCAYKNELYTSESYKLAKKTNDSGILLHNGQFGRINYFILDDENKVKIYIELFTSEPFTVGFLESRAIFKVKKLRCVELPLEDIKSKVMYVNLSAKMVSRKKREVENEETVEYVMILPPLSDIK